MQENKTEKDQIISDYLRADPIFFERNAHLLAELYLPSPHGNGAISLTERQQLAQRDKIRAQEAMMFQLIENAKENDETTQKIHALSVDLLIHRQLNQIATIVGESMQAAFQVDSAHLHCWMPTHHEAWAKHPIFAPFPEIFSQWVSTLEQPYCGEKPAPLAIYLEEALKSFAFIPLFKKITLNQNPAQESPALMQHLPTIGVLILASKDEQHFKADMGTVFLSRIGDLVSAALVNAALVNET